MATVSEGRLIKCEHPGCETLLAPDGHGYGKNRSLCSQHWREARKRRESEGVERASRAPSLSQMIRNALRPGS